MSVNKVILLGRLGRDPELKTMNGYSHCRFSIATSKKWKDKSGEMQERTEWHNLVAWNRNAEVIAEYLKKGMMAYFEGEIESEEYIKDGEKKKDYRINVQSVRLIESKGKTENHTPAPSYAPQDDDIPF